jgi:hypothetical protein
MRIKSTFCLIDKYEYKGGAVFDAGFVKKSPHKEDDIYFQIGGTVFHLRDDEVFAIIAMLGRTMWCLGIARLNNYSRFRFKTLNQMKKVWFSKRRKK